MNWGVKAVISAVMQKLEVKINCGEEMNNKENIECHIIELMFA